MIDIHPGDAVQWARDYSGDLFHALLCDAPYEMNFMNRDWDGSGVAFDPETWRAFAGVLHPGAFLFVFAGTINDDLISVAMREAGLRKFHKMMGWCYGSGFPKASRIDTQIDKAAGAEREVVGRADVGPNITGGNYERSNGRQVTDITIPATDLARTWAGHRYGLQALKPAIETVLIFQKPYEGRPIDNITQTGAGALWVDGGRIGTDESDDSHRKRRGGWERDGYVGGSPVQEMHYQPSTQGRWPANFYLDAEAARRLDEQSGNSESKRMVRPPSFSSGPGKGAVHEGWVRPGHANYEPFEKGYNDTGGASRFFFRVEEQIDDADPVRYVAKASRAERDAGLEGFWFPGEEISGGGGVNSEKADAYQARKTSRHNPHPTVKPLALTRYLATLLLPPAEYAPRRLFVPFAGVASEAIGAMQAGWEHIEGVEITEEYLPIARARIEYWRERNQAELIK